MTMLSVTLTEYKTNFQANLDEYLKQYEDNTEKFFLHKELASYGQYYNKLVDISSQVEDQLRQQTKEVLINGVRADELKEISPVAHGNIMTRKTYTVRDSGPPDFLWEGSPPYKSIVDVDKLENHISSANAILEFITEQMNTQNVVTTPIKHSVKPTTVANTSKDAKKENSAPDDMLKATIEDYLEEFKESIKYDGYVRLVEALYQYFNTGSFPVLTSKIEFVQSNKKKIGWALKELYMSERTDTLSYDYLLFSKNNINLFSTVKLEKDNLIKSNLYKYFTTKVP